MWVIQYLIPPAALQDPNDRWWLDVKASDEFLDRVFAEYLFKLNLPLSLMKKSDYHGLAKFVPSALISPDIVEVLDAILEVSAQANPVV